MSRLDSNNNRAMRQLYGHEEASRVTEGVEEAASTFVETGNCRIPPPRSRLRAEEEEAPRAADRNTTRDNLGLGRASTSESSPTANSWYSNHGNANTIVLTSSSGRSADSRPENDTGVHRTLSGRHRPLRPHRGSSRLRSHHTSISRGGIVSAEDGGLPVDIESPEDDHGPGAQMP